VAASHLSFLDDHRGRYVWRSNITAQVIPSLYAESEHAVLATFDVDAVDAAWAPGVSTPTIGGLSNELWLAAAYQAGRSNRVASFDLCEVNPVYDVDGRTARLGAVTVWQLLRGLAERE
jgi:formiminoglutamase